MADVIRSKSARQDASALEPHGSKRAGALRLLFRNKVGMAGLLVVVLFLMVALFAPLIAPKDPYRTDLTKRLQPPSAEHFLGTDELGRDLASRIMHGTRVSLLFGVGTTLVAVIVGLVLGVVSGFFGGLVDSLIMRAMDLVLIFPDILLAIAIVSALGPGLANAMVAIAIGSVPMFARTIRAQTLSIRERDFVTASRALGSRSWRIVLRHVLPNAVAAIIVLGTLRVGTAILAASTLSFLGLGVQAPTPEWGAILAAGRGALRSGPHLMLFPGIVLSIVVLAFASLGDVLRDVLDPRYGR